MSALNAWRDCPTCVSVSGAKLWPGTLYVVGTSTFGTTGGYLIPGLMMGLLQIGWVAVVGAVSADFIMKGLNQTSKVLSSVIIIVWIYSLGWVAIKGIHYVGRVAKYLNWVPLIMILIVFYANRDGIANYHPAHHEETIGFLNVLTSVIGYFATAGAAGADFGMNNANRKDVILGGICGVVGGALIAGGLPLLSVAGYLGRGAGPQSYDYTAAISSVGALAPVMFFLFAIASMVPTCFSSFIASNSFSTMLPKIPRAASTLAALTFWLSQVLRTTWWGFSASWPLPLARSVARWWLTTSALEGGGRDRGWELTGPVVSHGS
jgi:cytosine permease